MLGFIPLTKAGVPMGELTVFDVDFNDRTPCSFLGEGGSTVGEPSDLSGLTAEVVELSPGDNYIEVEMDPPSTSARRLRWDVLDGNEVSEGVIAFSFQFTPSALDRYNISFREGGGSSRSFLNVNFYDNGLILANDAAGSITVTNNSYTATVTQDITIILIWMPAPARSL